MEKKATIVSITFICLILIMLIAYIIISGIVTSNYNYVQLEINPRVEFLCDKKDNVISLRPLNNDAEILLSGTNYIGKNIEKVSLDFIQLCAMAGYIDVDKKDNAIKLTILDGLTQRLDVNLNNRITNYLKQNQIYGVIVNNNEDKQIYNEKKKYNISSSNKYQLIKTTNQLNNNLTIDKLKKYSEKELMEIIKKEHQNYKYNTSENIELKTKLIDFNREKYNAHINKINKNSQREFANTYEQFIKKSLKEYNNNFNQKYDNWQNNHIS